MIERNREEAANGERHLLFEVGRGKGKGMKREDMGIKGEEEPRVLPLVTKKRCSISKASAKDRSQ